MKINFKAVLLGLCLLAFCVQAVEATEGVSRRSFLAMLGGALGAAAMGPQMTLLAEKVVTTRVSDAEALMRIQSSLDFDFLRRSAWERYFTGKVTVNPSAPLGNELEMLQRYRAQLAEFVNHPAFSEESKELARILFRNTNDIYPFDISPKEYVERAKNYFERARVQTVDLRSEETLERIKDSYDDLYEKIRGEFENGEAERAVRLSLCRQYLQ
ncbi:MAG: twin-arginine translocation signal domain-containing protein [Bdellovibrionaceae bacterium]|nr:twin-arginine translocation signal domain-containing protein [Pseudobdellovibrionaceae bacterium]